MEQIIQEIQQGNWSKFDILLQEFQPILKSVCRKYFLVGSDYDDLLQEARIALYIAAKTYDPRKSSNFEAFAYMVVKRKVISAVRQSQRKKHETLNQSLSLYYPVFENRVYIDSLEDRTYVKNIDSIEQPFAVEVLFQKYGLTKLERTVLTHYLQGYSYNEIMSMTGRDYKSIDNAMQRIRKKIKTYYQTVKIAN